MRKLICLLALAACAGDDDSGDGGGGGSGSADAPSNSGSVSLSSYNLAGPSPSAGGGAAAIFTLPRTGDQTCMERSFGACRLITCPAATWMPTYMSGGTITVTGLSAPITLAPQPDKTYTAFSTQQQPLFSGGETITIKGAGADVPAFMVSITAPSRASITSPPKPAVNGAVVINRAQDFTVSWTGGGTDTLYVLISNPAGAGGGSIFCDFDAKAGSAKIPSAALSMLSAGMSSFGAVALTRKSVDVDDWRIYGMANFSAVWASDSSNAVATAMLQ
jgi:hypothetical protein